MKMTSGRDCCRYSSACSADSAASTVMPSCSCRPLRITLADRESSTIRARLPVAIPSFLWRTPEMAPRVPAFYLEPGLKPIPANASGSGKRRGYARIEDSIAKTEAENALFDAGHPQHRPGGPSRRGQDAAGRSLARADGSHPGQGIAGARDDRVRFRSPGEGAAALARHGDLRL